MSRDFPALSEFFTIARLGFQGAAILKVGIVEDQVFGV
jgi:hypothetical protein